MNTEKALSHLIQLTNLNMIRFGKLVLIPFLLLPIISWSQHYTEKKNKGIVAEIPLSAKGKKVKIGIDVISPNIVKVAVAKDDSTLGVPSLIANDNILKSVKHSVKEKGNKVEIKTDSLIVSLDLRKGKVSFFDIKGKLLLAESVREIVPFENEIVGHQNKIKQGFIWNKDEVHYGLGQNPNENINLRGQKIALYQENTRIAIPVLVSTMGYGIYWDNYSVSEYNDIGGNSYLASEIGDKIQYYFMKGKRLDNIVANYRLLTGEAPLAPRWTLGYFQSRNRYHNREELMDAVTKQRALNVPMDAVVLDYFHWGKAGMGSMVFGPEDFPDAQGMINDLHDKYNCKLLLSVWPAFEINSPHWKLFNDENLLLDVDLGSWKDQVFGQVYDAFNSKAGQLYFDLIKKGYYNMNVDAIWFDATEPEKWELYIKSKCFLGPTAKFANLYSYFDMKNNFERLIKESDKRIFTLTRSAFAGQQKFGSMVWSGDIKSDFKTLKEQIPTGLNYCMSGLPYWNTDIGGYLNGNPDDPKFRELFTRWFQYGAFTPVFRSHGRRFLDEKGIGHNEIWSYGEETQKILTKYINLRYRLLPYTYTIARRINTDGYTMMRSLAFDFMNDKNVLKINDQFMFGESFLVSPVLEEGATSRKLYLPAGVDWFNFWTGTKSKGGQTIEVDAPIDIIPLFVKAGSIIPVGPVVQYASENYSEPLELRIYSGKDGKYSLYEDENENYNYQKGKFTEIPISYSEKDRTVTIGERIGEFNGMKKERLFNIVIVNEKNGIGINESESSGRKSISYNGMKVIFSLIK